MRNIHLTGDIAKDYEQLQGFAGQKLVAVARHTESKMIPTSNNSGKTELVEILVLTLTETKR